MSSVSKKSAQGQQATAVRFYRRQYPEVGELVVGTVKRIEEHGAYITLDEYGGVEAYAYPSIDDDTKPAPGHDNGHHDTHK